VDYLLSCDGVSGKIYKHSGFSKTISDSFSTPGTNPAGIEWISPPPTINVYDSVSVSELRDLILNNTRDLSVFDSVALSESVEFEDLIKNISVNDSITINGVPGRFLFMTDIYNGVLYKFDGFSDTILDSFSSPLTAPFAITFMGDDIISSDAPYPEYDGRIYKHSGFTKTILDSFSSPSAAPTGLAYDGIDLISADQTLGKIYKHSGFSATISDSFSSPSEATGGLSRYGNNLFSMDYAVGKIYKHSGFSATISDSFSLEGVEGLAVDHEGNVIAETYVDLNDKIYK